MKDTLKDAAENFAKAVVIGAGLTIGAAGVIGLLQATRHLI